MAKLLIIADDFTGALDTGVQFSKRGAVTRVITGSLPAPGDCSENCDVLVIDSETRHVPADEAYRTVRHIVTQAEKLGIAHIYKKTDSALRGNVGAELAAVLDGSGETAIPFLPAFPQMERTTVHGIHCIKGIPVAESIFGQDPFSPVRESRVTALLGMQTRHSTNSYPAVSENGTLPKEAGIWVLDASSEADLLAAGKLLKRENRLHIMAGCAGFAAVLPDLLEIDSHAPRPIPVLESGLTVVCGSVNPVTVSQIACAKRHGAQHICLTPEQKLNPQYWESPQGRRQLHQLEQLLEQHPLRILDTNDYAPAVNTMDYAARNNLTLQDVRKAVAGTIGCLVSRLFSHPRIGTLLITGGDTLLQCMEYMGVREIEPLCEPAAGVVLARFAYKGVSRCVITKSGGFGGEDLILQLYEMTRAKTAETHF